MANKYSGTQTEKNLEAAFAGESQARNKYTYFASVAKKEGYEPSDTITYEIDPRVLMGIIGDVNNDGKVNGTDIQEVINIIVNKSEI